MFITKVIHKEAELRLVVVDMGRSGSAKPYVAPDGSKKRFIPPSARAPKVKVKEPRKSPKAKGQGSLRKWKDGTGEVRVGRTVVKLMEGEEDCSSWTDEELMRGAPLSVKRLPHVIPLMVYQELVKRIISKAQHRFAAELEMAIGKHIAIIKHIDPKDVTPTQWAAIRELEDRVMGKAAEHVVHHDGDAPWKKLVAESIVSSVEQIPEEGEIVEGEVVEEESA